MARKPSVDYRRGYPVTVNHPEQTDFIAKVAAEVGAGERAVDTTIVPLMGAEDFSYMLESRPGAYIFMGNGDTAGVHHPAYNFNDEAIPYGVSLLGEGDRDGDAGALIPVQAAAGGPQGLGGAGASIAGASGCGGGRCPPA